MDAKTGAMRIKMSLQKQLTKKKKQIEIEDKL